MSRPKAYADGRVATSLRIKREVLDRLDAEAEARDVSRNWLISRLIDRGLDSLAPAGDPEATR